MLHIGSRQSVDNSISDKCRFHWKKEWLRFSRDWQNMNRPLHFRWWAGHSSSDCQNQKLRWGIPDLHWKYPMSTGMLLMFSFQVLPVQEPEAGNKQAVLLFGRKKCRNRSEEIESVWIKGRIWKIRMCIFLTVYFNLISLDYSADLLCKSWLRHVWSGYHINIVTGYCSQYIRFYVKIV